jgi:hypothetical protein
VGILLAVQLAAGLLLPVSVFAGTHGRATMACCMMHGRCDCGHSDASFARCTGQDALTGIASLPAAPAPAAGALAGISAGERLLPEDTALPGLLELVPPTPPPRG